MSQMCPSCSRDNQDNISNCIFCHEPLLGLLGSNTVLIGRYRVSRVLGCGGMGAVYLADDLRIAGRQVAVKENLNTHPHAQTQFQSEVGLMATLRHPNLPAVSDQFRGPTGRQYMVMDYVAGDTLEDLVARRGPLPEAEVIALADALLGVLEYLHGQGVVHRDIKPANVKLTPEGKPVLVDFGIAKVHVPGQPTKTWARGVGSPGFAPIEQYGTGTDVRSDLYSLGAVMYYLLTGKAPPPAPDLASGTPLTPPRKLQPGVTLDMQRLVFRAMALNPGQRYQSATEMRKALAGLGQTSVPGPAPMPALPPTPPAPKRAPARAWVWITLLTVGVIGGGLWAANGMHPVPTPVVVERVVLVTATPNVTSAGRTPSVGGIGAVALVASRTSERASSSKPTVQDTPSLPLPTPTPRPTWTPTPKPTLKPIPTLTPTPARANPVSQVQKAVTPCPSYLHKPLPGMGLLVIENHIGEPLHIDYIGTTLKWDLPPKQGDVPSRLVLDLRPGKHTFVDNTPWGHGRISVDITPGSAFISPIWYNNRTEELVYPLEIPNGCQ